MAKGAGAKAAKAEAAAAKADQGKKQAEQKEAEEWSKGAKGKSKAEDAKASKEAAAARKAEAARLLAEEEASAPKPKAASKPAPKKSTPKPPPAPKIPSFEDGTSDEITSFSASNIDDALDALTLVNERTDKATMGAKANMAVETHPERKFKAAFEAYKEAQLPIIKKDFPGLRLQQYHDRLYKDFQKSPDNPFNQTVLAYDATKEEKVAALKKMRDETAQRLRSDQD